MTRPYQPPQRRWSFPATVGLILVAVVFVYPFLWMLLAAFKSNVDIFNPKTFWPSTWDLEPARRLLGGEWFPFWRVFFNSLFIALTQSLIAVIITSLAGYVFANSRSWHSRILFFLSLVVIVIPVQALAVSLFVWTNDLHLIDRLWGVILPGAVSGLGVIWFTQIFRQVPATLREAARLDGANEWRVWWMLLPALLPALISFALIHFVLAWHEHLLALLILQSPEQQTLPVAISSLYSSSLRFPYAALMAGSVLTLIPTMILFALCFRRFKSALADVIMH